MPAKHRTRNPARKKAAAVGVATATITALSMGAAPPPRANAAPPPLGMAATQGSPGLPPMELAPGAPDPASIPDLTFGLGSEGYDLFQELGAALESGIVDRFNLAGLLQALGYDPESVINAALGTLLTQTLAGVPIDLSGIPVLGPILTLAGITNVAALTGLLGLNLSDPLNLSGVPTPGIDVITAGPPFTLLKLLGVDLGWVPGFPNSVADEINGAPYLDVSTLGILNTLLKSFPVPPLKNTANNVLLQGLIATVGALPDGDISLVNLRIPVVAGFGLGAFAAGMAYPQIVAQLPEQPGGAQYTGSKPLLGSITVLPLVLLRNPGRANGGLFARFYPEAALLGIDTVTPDTEVSSSVNPDNLLDIPVGSTAITVGGANLIPVKIDGTVEYDALSDVPAWPNPFALANSAAALLFPTYILRGVTADSLTEVVGDQLTPQVADALANAAGGPLALNFYLTLPVHDALPLLEPVRLPVDVINLLTGANLNNPIATALEPVLTTLVNLGYTDVQRTVVNGVPVYNRTLDQADVITPFGTLPSGVDWGQVPADLFVELGAGIAQAIDEGLVSHTPVVNPLATIAHLLGLGDSQATPAAALNVAATNPAPAQSPRQQKVLVDNKTDAVTTPATQAKDRVDDTVKKAVARTDAAANRAAQQAETAFKSAGERVDKIAKDGQEQIRKVVKSGQSGTHQAVKPPAKTTARAAEKSSE